MPRGGPASRITSRCCGPARVAAVCCSTPRPASRVALPATERRPLCTCGGRARGQSVLCNGTWACFDCRTAVRRPTWRRVTFERPWLLGSIGVGRVKCPSCGQPCRFLGPTVEVPRKQAIKKWRDLGAAVSRQFVATAADRAAAHNRICVDYAKRVAALQLQPPTASRDRQIAKLQGVISAFQPAGA